MTSRTDALSDALERLADYRYLDEPGLASHAPMAAEALSSLGYDDEVGPWVEAYKARHAPMGAPPPRSRIDARDADSWQGALGDFGRVSDWNRMFSDALEDQPRRAVVQRWMPRLLPGYGGGLTHGLLRVAHAVRALPTDAMSSDTIDELAAGELARGLATWAAFYQPLPATPRLQGSLSLDRAVAQLPRPDEPWTPMEAVSFSRLGDVPGWDAAVQALEAPRAAEDALSDLTAGFCRVLSAGGDALTHWAVHVVTPAAAIRTLLPLVPELPIETVYAHLWQVNAALVTGLMRPTGAASTPPTEPAPTPAQLAARAAEHGDFHVVKFTEAALREHALRPEPAYLLAAQRFLDLAPAW
jgi:hypothetical protein